MKGGRKIRKVDGGSVVPEKLERTVNQVCSQGYVRHDGKWYRGCSPVGEKPKCTLCDFPGCDIL